jgi:hypothetical protein
MIEVALFAVVVIVLVASTVWVDWCTTRLIRARLESNSDAYDRGFEDGSRGARALDRANKEIT